MAERAGLGGSFEPLPADFMARAPLPTKPTPLQEVMLRFAESPEWGVMAGQLVDSYREKWYQCTSPVFGHFAGAMTIAGS